MLVRGSLLWHETRTHMVGGGEGRNGGNGGEEVGRGGTASSAGGIGWNLVRNIRDPPELGLRRGLQPSLWIWPCAHTFSKLNFDPPGWKGSHCRRQFSIFSPSAPLSLPLCPRYLPSLPPSAGSFLFLFTRRGRSHAYPTDTMLLDVGEFLERTCPPPSLPFPAKKGMPSPTQLLPRFSALRATWRRRVRRGPIKLLVPG